MSIHARLISLVAVITVFIAASCQRSGVQAAREDQAGLTSQKILSMDDQNFLVAAYKNQIKQKTLAQIVLPKSKSGDVVEFARQVMDDRNASLAELTGLMHSRQIDQPPEVAETLQLESVNLLRDVSGDALDDKFLSLITAEQQQELASFDSASETAADPDVRNYVRATLPSLQRDLDRSAALEKKLAGRNQR